MDVDPQDPYPDFTDEEKKLALVHPVSKNVDAFWRILDSNKSKHRKAKNYLQKQFPDLNFNYPQNNDQKNDSRTILSKKVVSYFKDKIFAPEKAKKEQEKKEKEEEEVNALKRMIRERDEKLREKDETIGMLVEIVQSDISQSKKELETIECSIIEGMKKLEIAPKNL